MPEINPLTNNQIFLKKIAENTGSAYETGDVSEINPLTIDQIFLKEIAANTDGQSGDISELEDKVADNTSAIEAITEVYGAKNLLPNDATSQTVGGVTFTVNVDGSVTANGTATELVLFSIGSYSLVAGNTYVLSGCPNGGSDTSYVLQYRKDDGTELLETGEGVTYKSNNGQTNSLCRIIIQNGVTVSNLTFYPMIRDARITDPTYVPYAMTNRELTERVKVLTIPISSVTIDVASVHILHNNPCPTGYIPISAMFDRGAVSNDSVLLTVYLDSGTDVRVIMYNFSNSSIELNGSVKVLCIKA